MIGIGVGITANRSNAGGDNTPSLDLGDGITATISDMGGGDVQIVITAPAQHVGTYDVTAAELATGLAIFINANLVEGPAGTWTGDDLWLWTADDAPTYLQQWVRDGTTVIGTGDSYTLATPADDFKEVAWRVTAQNSAGNAVSPDQVVQAAPVQVLAPAIIFDGATDYIASTNDMYTSTVTSLLMYLSFTPKTAPGALQRIIVSDDKFSPRLLIELGTTGQLKTGIRDSAGAVIKTTDITSNPNLSDGTAVFDASRGNHASSGVSGHGSTSGPGGWKAAPPT